MREPERQPQYTPPPPWDLWAVIVAGVLVVAGLFVLVILLG